MAVLPQDLSLFSISFFFLQLLVLTSSSALIILYFYLRFTTSRDPDLSRAESEKSFLDPNDGTRKPFPLISDPPTVQLSLVVPAYNEQDRFPIMIKETLEYLHKRKQRDSEFTYEILVVNDGSKDNTSKVVMEYVKKEGPDRMRLLDFVRNRGKGGAVRAGCLSARGKRILFLDADGATDIKGLDELEKAMNSVSSDSTSPAIVVGSRAHLEDEAVANRSFFRNILMYGFHFLVFFLCVKGVRDTQCGFKLLTRSAVDRIFTNLHIERWAFDVEMLYIAQCLNIPIKEVAVNWQEIEGSKMIPVFSWIQMGRDLLFIRLRYMFGFWTIKAKTS
ncbi:PREDICTED: dolichyl-phosphate beta-glucosyltransferase-like isoform X2 [Amphimedon queenslandica]|uniref:Dolichyl-phosphate beta-glucosyltransferase n=1 Tax=Amphimedon queenslandica TaxID=400682 RepID=A0A1X7V397_AMPQE|nr:PREDICTED: dolichyl-phosphate beta-glucosyltransferase-like isoform X2 [Amphimedon queenslandica]|eukprot:XP_019850850.1 PREDICTED: dolichyl-phosphate beta-glucosyltransferase-like isoform X2 [Amphimedon queenslandica]